MAEKPGTKAWRQPRDRSSGKPKGLQHVLAQAVVQEERYVAGLGRQRDIINRLQSENVLLRGALEAAGLPDPTGRSSEAPVVDSEGS